MKGLIKWLVFLFILIKMKDYIYLCRYLEGDVYFLFRNDR